MRTFLLPSTGSVQSFDGRVANEKNARRRTCWMPRMVTTTVSMTTTIPEWRVEYQYCLCPPVYYTTNTYKNGDDCDCVTVFIDVSGNPVDSVKVEVVNGVTGSQLMIAAPSSPGFYIVDTIHKHFDAEKKKMEANRYNAHKQILAEMSKVSGGVGGR